MSTPDHVLLGEAADWLIQFQSGPTSPAERRAFERWRTQSLEHEAAWQRAERVLGTFEQLPVHTTRATLSRLQKPGRRQILRMLGVACITGPAVWAVWRELPWADWHAEIRTATGEQKTMRLSDGTQLLLNTASAVDIAFTETERRIILRAGEVLVTTGKDPGRAYRPFLVETREGTARAIGTRFSVQLEQENTRVRVFEGTVEVLPFEGFHPVVLHAGEQTVFAKDLAEGAQPVDPSAAAWEYGMFVARDVRLADLIAELSRYRRGVLRCDPACADMRVSGAFPITDINASLGLLQKTLPLRVTMLTRYWITVHPR